MTANPETRYHCDRCDSDTVTPLDSGGPAHGRMAGPNDWLMMRLGTDPAAPPQHLCEKCHEAFLKFMREGKG